MNKFLSAALGVLLLLSACQRKDARKPDAASTAPATPATAPAPTPTDRTAEYLSNPQVGDVLVVRFFPKGGAQERFYFYRIFRVSGDSILTNPARQPAASATADISGMEVFAPQAVRTYTRQELVDFQKEDPIDPQHSKLVQIRRGQ
ncbi:hypothetical protein D3Y59_08510 [Hymenobacter oligotrophus]|uniref:Uncharacterized protein n=1 Tax=Hymenobacter oligotrophus TaxID=2319843 RepID=A0A3B7R041_9BACT|nr:hypothetical protein [Hymenobacter oligotrophus]AYA37092.1 hypothetical protein D3Y59_08510 [Hymenobacter oligotrophus]